MKFIHSFVIILLALSAIASLFLTIRAGSHNSSLILVLMFIAWVALPFIIMGFCYYACKNWIVLKQKILFTLIIVLSLISPMVYSNWFKLKGTKNGFVFLMFPLISIFIISIATPFLSSLFKRRKFLNLLGQLLYSYLNNYC